MLSLSSSSSYYNIDMPSIYQTTCLDQCFSILAAQQNHLNVLKNKKTKPRFYYRPIISESLEEGSSHQYFVKLPRWFQLGCEQLLWLIISLNLYKNRDVHFHFVQKKPRLSKIKNCIQCHMPNSWQSSDSNPVLSGFRVHILSPKLY